jgi:hypothetical protein
VALSLPSAYADGGRLKAGARGTNFSLPRMSVDEAGVGGRCEEAICVAGRYDKSGTLMVSQATEYVKCCSRKRCLYRQGNGREKGIGGLS